MIESKLKTIDRIENFLKYLDLVELKKYSNHGEQEKKVFIDFGQKFSERDQKNDEVISLFIKSVKKDDLIGSLTRNKRMSMKEEKQLANRLIFLAGNFYGGFDDTQFIEDENEKRVEMLSTVEKRDVFLLGDLKGCGLQKHRAILFKLLCDIFGMECRILQGCPNTRVGNTHMWNEILIRTTNKKEIFVVDCLNSPSILEEPKILSHYTNIHTGSLMKYLEVTRAIESKYELIRGKEIRSTSQAGEPRESRVHVIEGKKINQSRMNFAVKEYGTLDKTKEKTIVKEIEIMRLFQQHPNFVDILGTFRTSDGTKLHVVMKKYDMNCQTFINLLSSLCSKRVGQSSESYHHLTESLETEILVLLCGVLSGLNYLHSFGITHSNLKLENVLVNWDDKFQRVKSVHISDINHDTKKNESLDLQEDVVAFGKNILSAFERLVKNSIPIGTHLMRLRDECVSRKRHISVLELFHEIRSLLVFVRSRYYQSLEIQDVLLQNRTNTISLVIDNQRLRNRIKELEENERKNNKEEKEKPVQDEEEEEEGEEEENVEKKEKEKKKSSIFRKMKRFIGISGKKSEDLDTTPPKEEEERKVDVDVRTELNEEEKSDLMRILKESIRPRYPCHVFEEEDDDDSDVWSEDEEENWT